MEEQDALLFHGKRASRFKKELDTSLRLLSCYLEDAGIGEIVVVRKEFLHTAYEDEWQAVADE